MLTGVRSSVSPGIGAPPVVAQPSWGHYSSFINQGLPGCLIKQQGDGGVLATTAPGMPRALPVPNGAGTTAPGMHRARPVSTGVYNSQHAPRGRHAGSRSSG